MRPKEVIHMLAELFGVRRMPKHIRSRLRGKAGPEESDRHSQRTYEGAVSHASFSFKARDGYFLYASYFEIARSR